MKPLFVAVWLVVFCGTVCGQNNLEDRLFDWSSAGLETDIRNNEELINFVSSGGDNTGASSNSALLQQLIDEATEKTTIFFPLGEYLFEETILMKSDVSILGASTKGTKFIFDLGGFGHCFIIRGSRGNLLGTISQQTQLKDKTIGVDPAGSFEKNQMILLDPEDGHLVSSDWAIGTTGQITRITDVVNNQISIVDELRRVYESQFLTEIIEIHPIENVFFSSFSIERLDETTYQTSNFHFSYAYNCKLSCVNSKNTNFAHAALGYSYHIELSSCRFEDGFSYGGGGKAYGAAMQNASSSNLLFNCVFKHLRHSMLLQSGANGNVLAYNFSSDPFWQGTSFNDDAAGDLVLHGNYPYANLFEGNIVQNLVIDQSHGSNGPYNTIFRNRVEHYGFFAANLIRTHQLNIIGNEIVNPGFGYGLFYLNGDDHYVYGNNIKGDFDESEMNGLNDQSLYLTENPFMDEGIAWPVIGFPQEFNQSEQYAQRSDEDITELCLDNIIGLASEDIQLKVFPNPTDGRIRIISKDVTEIYKVEVFDFIGKRVAHHTISNFSEIDISTLPSGIYFLRFFENQQMVDIQKVILN